ncbi:MAG: FlgD immunoglobulin-like domain containing protein [Candidatus Poribacteria bacterium]
MPAYRPSFRPVDIPNGSDVIPVGNYAYDSNRYNYAYRYAEIYQLIAEIISITPSPGTSVTLALLLIFLKQFLPDLDLRMPVLYEQPGEGAGAADPTFIQPSRKSIPERFPSVDTTSSTQSIIAGGKFIGQLQISSSYIAPEVECEDVPRILQIKYNTFRRMKTAVLVKSNDKVIANLIKESEQLEGERIIDWDGKDANGQYVPPGEYTIELTTEDKTTAKASVEVKDLIAKLSVPYG